MEDVNEMVNALWLTDEIHWDLALYGLFLLNVILLLMQPEGSSFTTMLGGLVILSIMIDKTHAFGYMLDPGVYEPVRYHEEIFIGTYLIRVIMFVAPLSIAASTKNSKSRGIGVVAGVGGGAYMFIRWYMEQRDVSTQDVGLGYLDMQIAVQSIGMLLVLARIALRNRLYLGAVHRDIPATVVVDIAPDDVEVQVA
ncbi:MAG: hypothetical protein JXJ20_12570 [Anaerolineae bacterium]|nr:hypothetical protein [Anaerolineae bacterium]